MIKKLTFTDHIHFAVNTVNSVLGFVKREMREMCDPYCAKTLFIALVRPIMEYACQVWSPHCVIYILQELNQFQKYFFHLL